MRFKKCLTDKYCVFFKIKRDISQDPLKIIGKGGILTVFSEKGSYEIGDRNVEEVNQFLQQKEKISSLKITNSSEEERKAEKRIRRQIAVITTSCVIMTAVNIYAILFK